MPTPPRAPHDSSGSVAEPGDEDSPKICFCMFVHEATLRRAIERGARTLRDLQEMTRAGTGCGTCRMDLQRLLDEAATP